MIRRLAMPRFVLVYVPARKRRMRAWRNGRRAGFRCQWASAREGSTPFARTIESRKVGLYKSAFNLYVNATHFASFFPSIIYNVQVHLANAMQTRKEAGCKVR